jgi:hypothetical protein
MPGVNVFTPLSMELVEINSTVVSNDQSRILATSRTFDGAVNALDGEVLSVVPKDKLPERPVKNAIVLDQ